METSFVASSPQHRVLIPEVVQKILKSLNTSTLASAALVCNSWSDMALDVLWREIRHLVPLLKILAPMIAQNGYWSLVNGLANADWHRFGVYSRRVRSLSYHGPLGPRSPDEPYPVALESVFRIQVCLPSNQRHILPNITSLKWVVGHQDRQDATIMLAFMSPTVKQLKLSSTRGIRPLLGGLEHIATLQECQLVSLDLSDIVTDWLASRDDRGLVLCIQQNPNLQVVRLPLCRPADNLLHATSNLRELQTLMIQITVETWDEFSDMLAELAGGCPLLQDIECMLNLEDGPLQEVGPMYISCVRPLFQLRKLSRLAIDYDERITFGTDDIAAMGNAWPQIRVLQLSVDEFIGTPVDPPLSNLVDFARYFPSTLTKLHLRFRTGDLSSLPNSLYDGTTPKFSNLRNLRITLGDLERPPSHEMRLTIADILGHLTVAGVLINIYLPSWLESDEEKEQLTDCIDAMVRVVHHARLGATSEAEGWA